MTLPFDLAGRVAVVATMHGKEKAITPPLTALGLRFAETPPIDTDAFGTFTRDVARTGDQREALVAKARRGLELAPAAQFAVASEGAFGPHPRLPFLPSGLEMVGLLERATGKAIIGQHLTLETNFAQVEAHSWSEAEAFAGRIGFSEHAMVVQVSRNGPVLAKGVQRLVSLRELIEPHVESAGSVWLEADMRAHLNPTRMAAIALATEDLARRIRSRCPRCRYPDWMPQIEHGRPCGWCHGPTLDAWVEQWRCDSCGHAVENVIEPDRPAQPGLCTTCNP